MNLYFAIPFLPGGNLEWIIVIMAALMIFGSRLPEVALRAVAHVMRFRRAIAKMWHETGLEDELRRVRRDIELSIPREADFKVKDQKAKAKEVNEARAAAERAREAAERNARNQAAAAQATDVDVLSVDPDAHRRGEFRLEPAEGTVAGGEWTPDAPSETPSDPIPDLGPDPDAGPEIRPVSGAAARPAPAFDPVERDRTPGTDRQEPTEYYSEVFENEAPFEDEPVQDPPADRGAEPDTASMPESAPDLGGSHFGAGIQPPPSRPS